MKRYKLSYRLCHLWAVDVSCSVGDDKNQVMLTLKTFLSRQRMLEMTTQHSAME